MRAALLVACACALTALPCAKPSADHAGPAGASDGLTVSTANSAARVDVDAHAPDAAPRGQLGPPKDVNVLLVSIDSLRADMPWAGYARDIAPNLTALEKKSVNYTHSYSISSYTSMSLGGLLAGRYPSELQRDGFFFGTYTKADLFFPEILQAHGIRTLGAQAHGYFKSAGFEQGFDAWEIVPALKWDNTTDLNITSDKHEPIAERLLSNAFASVDGGASATQFFAWFHFLDPHDEYMDHTKDGITPYGTALRDKYDGEVKFTDEWVGKLFAFVAAQPWGARTVIIVTADHGEAFGEHDMYKHGFEVWENLVHVPLFFLVPGVSPRAIDANRSAIDLAPTILDLFGLPPEPTFEGKSLVPELYGRSEPDERDVLVDLPMTSDNDKRRALVHGHEKMIAFGKDEYKKLFDLSQDPDEKSPVTKGDAFDAMAKRYADATRGIKEVAPYGCGPKCLNRAYLNDQK